MIYDLDRVEGGLATCLEFNGPGTE